MSGKAEEKTERDGWQMMEVGGTVWLEVGVRYTDIQLQLVMVLY